MRIDEPGTSIRTRSPVYPIIPSASEEVVLFAFAGDPVIATVPVVIVPLGRPYECVGPIRPFDQTAKRRRGTAGQGGKYPDRNRALLGGVPG